LSDSLAEQLDVVFTVTDKVSTVFVAPIAAELHRRGFRVGLVTNLHGQPPPAAIAPSLAWHTDLAMRRAPSPIHDLADLARMTRVLRRVRPTVVHASTPKAGLLGVLAGRAAGAPVVVFQVRGLRSEGATGLSGRIQRWTEQVSLSLANRVVLNSASMGRTAVASGLRVPANAQVIGQGSSIGVNCQRFAAINRPAPPEGSSRVTIGFVGRLHTDKGVADLIEVWDALSPTRPDLRMVVVGAADPTDPRSRALEAALATRPGIELAGQVDDVTTWLERMDVLAFPSYREGLPNAPLEAQASGIPVVGYAATGTVDAVEHGTGGFLVPVGDRNALTDAVATVIDDAALRAELGAAGQKFVQQNFDQNVVVADHADFIEELVRSAG
jgi:glycosyltransferase involved in cell wall biosynthesis